MFVYLWRVTVAVRREAARGGRVVVFPQDSVATGLASAIAGRLTRQPVVIMDHGLGQAIMTDFYWRERQPSARLRDRIARPMLRRLLIGTHWVALRTCDAVFLASQEAVDFHRANGVSDNRIFRYHVPVDITRFKPAGIPEQQALRKRFDLPVDRTVILSVSRLTPEKGLDHLLRSLARLEESERHRVVLVVVGDGRLRESLVGLAEDLGVPARFTGPVTDAELPMLLRSADIFAYSSRQGTNVPVATLEAMASGLAVVATTAPMAHTELLDEGRGQAIPPDDPDAMVRALRAVIVDRSIRRAHGRAARAFVEAHHAPAAFDDELEQMLRVVAPTDRRRRAFTSRATP